jgi:plastocyanin
MRQISVVCLLALALVAAACGGNESTSDDAVEAPADDMTAPVEDDSTALVEDTDVSTEPTAEEPVAPAATLLDYEAAAAEIPQAERDRDLPPLAPDSPIGSYGYSRYVYTQAGDEIIPSLVEGPLGYQVRCQEQAHDCSYQELKALYESGEDVPSYLGMDRETLGELVSQLGRVNVAINQYDDLDDACAAGMFKSTNQVANMGIHMIDNGAQGFDPDRPQMVLFAKDGGFGLGSGEIGNCSGGEWTGEDGYEPVGAVFNIGLTADHPEGFAGPIDNWHIHYNTCIGRSQEQESSLVNDPEVTGAAEGSRSSTSREACQGRGGTFLPVIPSWMMHTYVADDFDAQSGVFSMFNPTIWPLSDADTLADNRVVSAGDDVEAAPILNFDFGDINVGVGDTVRFANSDSVPHTVTAGSFFEPFDTFDSGVLGTGQAFDHSFDAPGEYALFCVLHPDMTGTVYVE